MTNPIVNIAALEPLFEVSAYPNAHRVRADHEGEPARVVKGRRPSPIAIVNSIRHFVSDWRSGKYAGASDTTRELLAYWFGESHSIPQKDGSSVPFRYYFCQREAVETLIYLMEVRRLTSLAQVVAEFGGPNSQRAALGIDPDEDRWAKYALKIATGAGKTKVMSLAMTWSYFHALRESDSRMARHFVVIAPNLTVFERLKQDFEDGRIFDADPLVPPAWRGDWHMSVVLQDEAVGATAGGVVYLTNIHRLYDTGAKRQAQAETYEWAGPAVSRSKALDTGKRLRDQITSHPRLMVLCDEAHHVWDPDSAWNEAIAYLNDTIRKRTGEGLVAQLDLSATPKDNKGQFFKHVVVDTPLGEAVDAGIVKTPIIGRGQELTIRTHDDAAYRFEEHLILGYKRWEASQDEWEKSGKKALLFVMTEDTKSADQIAQRLNSDRMFPGINGKTINLHTNLKGKLKKRGRGESAYYEFVETEGDISDEDLKELRKLSRELDENTSPYRCIVSVLMLREGWDVRNVTTIVPLRAYTSKANILPEQTLGRGLRRMTPPGQAAEVVSVVEHAAFASLYREQLSQEGLPIDVVDLDKIPRTTETIYPDKRKQNFERLDIEVPRLTTAHHINPQLSALTLEDVRGAFSRFKRLPLGHVHESEIDYEGRHLLTNEIVEQMKIKLPLLQDGFGAVSFFKDELERITGVRGTHPILAPLLQEFLEKVLFMDPTTLADQRLVNRLADADVREHVRAVFVPLIRARTVKKEARVAAENPMPVLSWRPFQVTHSERHPVEVAEKTGFNLVPCNRELEVAMTNFLDRAPDVAAFCKNAGPQALRIDYLSSAGRPQAYTADFFARTTGNAHFLIETKGRQDLDVPVKARAAIEWCKAASGPRARWEYVYVPQEVFARVRGYKLEELVRTCAPALVTLTDEAASSQMMLAFPKLAEGVEARVLEDFLAVDQANILPPRYRKAVDQAVQLFKFLEAKGGPFAPVFQPLLGPIDDAAQAIILERLSPLLPAEAAAQKDFFEPLLDGVKPDRVDFMKERSRTFKALLVHRKPIMPTGLLDFCLDYAKNSKSQTGGIFTAVRSAFRDLADSDLREWLKKVYDFRNEFIAHEKKELTDPGVTKTALKEWATTLATLQRAKGAKG